MAGYTNTLAIVLAWPETYCKCPNAWYDGLMECLGISKRHRYQVGHAAVVLIHPYTRVCRYFDFGRYHSPYGYGRVRSSDTDDDLLIHIKAELEDTKTLKNYYSILKAIKSNPSCHGEGCLAASLVSINYSDALEKALSMQKKEFIQYGPFVWRGTNCSRFVRTVLLAGVKNPINYLQLLIPKFVSPTPLSNVKVCSHLYIVNNETLDSVTI